MRHLVLVLGDQLDRQSAAFDDFDAGRDAVWMVEVAEEASYVWSHKARIAMFFTAMRHFAESLEAERIQVDYGKIDDPANRGSFSAELLEAVARHRPERLIVVDPGEWRVRENLRRAAAEAGVPIDLRPDRHFFCGVDEFRQWAGEKKQLRLEFFYREMRARHKILMDRKKPLLGKWNFDVENRGSFGKAGPDNTRVCATYPPDAITRDVIATVNRVFAEHPGELHAFDFPVTPAQAFEALDDFIRTALPHFGRYQDAMWTDEPILYHSRLSAAMNLKLLNPRVVVRAAEQAYFDGAAPIEAVEGFIRQILGWREYVRGIYWLYMPQYLERNHLQAHQTLPAFYWTGETDMQCMRQAVGQTLKYGYAHHIQRLMVTGLFSLLLGVEPRAIHEWYLAVYVDAVEWVELPNVLGMSQYGDGGVMASKPYIASGKYIQRMSNYCAHCRYNPAKSTGGDACPFTTLYWDFLMRHEAMLAGNPRMIMQVRNLKRIAQPERELIRIQAAQVRESLA